MRIGCLQFAPQVGDIDNNLNRADAVLNKSPDLEDLDLLVLPELAFTGYNFHSLAQITPFLEPSGSGISSLWARTTALKLNCNVVVGYPEKVDVANKWPTSPEFYNSAIMVNRDGETIANYRKSFLYAIDETWALEGRDGFYEDEIPDLGTVAMGICMDINPYKFEAPWHAFEFAFHVLEIQANLVILTMAWVTREHPRSFTQLPQEPDLETLKYWIQRLEPIIRSENEEEIIIVIANRTGVEDDCVFTGSSTVLGVKKGEVNLYGLLGRGVKEVLVVDTSRKPFAKVVKDDTGEEVEAGGAYKQPPLAQATGQSTKSMPSTPTSSASGSSPSKGTLNGEHRPRRDHTPEAIPATAKPHTKSPTLTSPR
ncbi:carbon-nitrogen family protein [Grosmannia clavigera kw1407]|uniref:Carbon-nitrogen family protein n=1 Tax=Grosmannia clavigera (strain kw1407 / UAMH 11150) TaxID=655863 RepID=F0XRA6_GROCL|nr:carbon-nitrogen family protein [Grosmannia clavigera kw1407]EFW99955.1 carbon-nitrogen family protein [Grosmannia clavigera kw1407]